MAISSVSRIYDAPDPILETDLDLLAKVNQYQQLKFDTGAKELQNEINNWSMLANVAKEQDKQYINAKLNNVVNGITSMGGVNLGDTNQVNSLKSLGYNIYGDSKAMNAVTTTQKLRNFMTDAQTKMNGKNGKNYDPTLYEYNLDKWNEWLNDDQVGTSFNGPTSLANGTFEQYQKRIAEELNKLQPDMESLPQGLTDAEKLNYIQVSNKYISKDRVREAVDALTNSNDRELISAHAWRNMSGVPDIRLVGLTTNGYNSKLSNLQRQYNAIQDAKNQTQDISQAERYTEQLSTLTSSMNAIRDQRNNLVRDSASGLSAEQRRALRDNVYFDAFKEGYANARSYTQPKSELKFNQGQAFKLKEARMAYEFAERQKLAVKKLDLQEQAMNSKNALSMMSMYGSSSGQLNANGVLGPAALAPLQLLPVSGDDANVLNNNIVKAADENFAAQSNNFYTEAYNYLANNPAYQSSLVKGANGNFVPKDQVSRERLEKALTTKVAQLDKIANMPLNERTNITVDDKEENLLKLSQNLQDAKLFQQQVRDLQNQVYESVGQERPRNKSVKIDFADGTNVTVSYEKLKQMKDSNDPQLQEWKNRSKKEQSTGTFGLLEDAARDIAGSFLEGFGAEETGKGLYNTSLTNALRSVDEYYDNSKVNKKWEEVSQTFNPYGRNVSLPKFKGTGVPPALTGYFADKVRQANPSAAVKQEDVDLNKIWVKFNPESENKVQYMAEVKYKKGTSKEGDRLATVDLTADVLNDPNGFVAKLYPQDNPQIVYGLLMDTDGKTPFDASNNYADALKTTSNSTLSHKYQIVVNRNNQNGLQSFSVNVLVPRSINGQTKYFTIPVKNIRNGGTTTFEPNYQYVTQYMNAYFQNDAAVNEFYKLHNIPVASTPPATSTSPTVRTGQ